MIDSRLRAAKSMPASVLAACIGLFWMMIATPAVAQSTRDIVAGANLGPGYAQILNLSATPDISAAHYRITGQDTQPTIGVARFPFEYRLHSLPWNSDLYGKVAGGYLAMKDKFPVSVPTFGDGKIDSHWIAYSLTAGLFARFRLGAGITVAPGIDAGIARIENRAGYTGTANLIKPLVDGLILNWQTNAVLLTPNLGLEWGMSKAGHRVSIRGHVAWSRIRSYNESDSVLNFDETGNVYSIRADHAAPTGFRFFDRPLDWVVYGGYGGFFGPNRDALGFTSVSEAGLGVELPLGTGSGESRHVRFGTSYLFGPNVLGWAVGLGLN